MRAADYEAMIHDTYAPDTETHVVYNIMGLSGEAGECANLAQKCMRGDFDETEFQEDGPRRDQLIDELGGLTYYYHSLLMRIGVTPEEVRARNAAKLRSRQARGTIRGDGDDR